jgi:hypothetical protein
VDRGRGAAPVTTTAAAWIARRRGGGAEEREQATLGTGLVTAWVERLNQLHALAIHLVADDRATAASTSLDSTGCSSELELRKEKRREGGEEEGARAKGYFPFPVHAGARTRRDM